MLKKLDEHLTELRSLIESDEDTRAVERQARGGDDKALGKLMLLAKRHGDEKLRDTVKQIATEKAQAGGVKALYALLKVAEAFKDKALSRIVDDIAFQQASQLISQGHSHGEHGKVPHSSELLALREIGMRTFVLRGNKRAGEHSTNPQEFKDSHAADRAALDKVLGFDSGDDPEALPRGLPE